MNAAFLAFAYLRHHWPRSLLLVLVAALILAVPLAAQVLLRGSEAALTDRAEATPLLLGRRGSQLDLVMSALYFSDGRAQPLTMADSDAVWDEGFDLPIPLHTAFATNGAQIVSTSLDYFDLRGLAVAEGRQIALLGEAVVGATVADRLGLAPGATLISSPENLFNLDGAYPLEMAVVGVLAPTGTADDAVFVDIKTVWKTAWVIAGIGHGHEDVAPDATARPDVLAFNRIMPETIESFHFHGAPEI